MARFRYTAIDHRGQRLAGMAEADNLDMLESRLQQRRLTMIRAKPVKPRKHLSWRRRIARRELINFCFQMEQMINAGVSLLDGLRDYADTLEPCHFQDVVAGLADKIESGQTFSEALRDFPEAFSGLYVNLVMAGEQSGELGKVLAHLTESLKWQDELVAQTKKALRYPAFVAVVVLGAVTFLMMYVVPQITAFIVSMEGQLPWHTKLLIATSDVFVNAWYWLLAVPLLALVAGRMLLAASDQARYRFDALKLRLWLIGPVLEKIMMARFAHYFSLLFNAGMPVLECVSMCEGVVGNAYVGRALRQARANIASGEKVSLALEETGLFPRLVIRLLKVGEQTGDLGAALANVNYFYRRDVDEAVTKMQEMIEPTLNILIGLVIGWVMLSVLGPVYDMIGKLKF